MRNEQLSLDQAPPLAIPLSFFFAAPLMLLLAALLMAVSPSDILLSPWLLRTLSLTHLGTLGFLGLVMVGALYQMIPVVAGARVPAVRIAHFTHLAITLGVAGIAAAGFLSRPLLLAWGSAFVAVGFLSFLLPTGWALLRTETRTGTVSGMRLALLGLTALVLMGLAMSRGLGGGTFPGPRGLWIQVHLSLAFTVWVGMLIAAVSWQVVPMFHLTPRISSRQESITLGCVALSLVALPIPLFLADRLSLETLSLAALAATAPSAFAVWLWTPYLLARSIRERKRKRPDATLHFWKAGLATAPFTLLSGLGAVLLDDPRHGLVFGWLAVWGWAGCIVHGMLHRIVPFLAWFHLLSNLAGIADAPSAKGLLKNARSLAGFRLHVLTLVLGLAAILLQASGLVLATALALALTSLHLLYGLVSALRTAQRARHAAASH